MSAPSSIPHAPLESSSELIRTLTLDAGVVSAPIKCSLQVVSLQDSPEYEALSYTWGDLGTTGYIGVDGVRVKVAVNLEIALRHTRHVENDIVLWVDASSYRLMRSRS